MKKTMIASDTLGKLKKICEGVVYSDTYIYITEFMQNSYRAGSKNLSIILNKEFGTLEFIDDGFGLKKPSDLLTLDYSSWNTTSEGFGIGFWSWLVIGYSEGFEATCEVISNIYNFKISKENILSGDLYVDINKIEKSKGFKVILTSDLFKQSDYTNKLLEVIEEVGSLLTFNIYFNGEYIAKKELCSIIGDHYLDVNNKYYSGKLALNLSKWSLNLYYERRFVKEDYVKTGVTGVLELKKGSLSLKEPDRRSYSYDSKYYEYMRILDKDIEKLVLSFLKFASDSQIDMYSNLIEEVIPVDIYSNYLSENIIYSDYESIKIEQIKSVLNSESGKNSEWLENSNLDTHDKSEVLTYSNIQDINKIELLNTDSVIVDGKLFVKRRINNIINYSQDDSKVIVNYDTLRNESNIEKKKLVKSISKVKKKVWLKLDELDIYNDILSRLGYLGVNILISKNILYEKTYKHKNIPHISEMLNSFEEVYIQKNVKIKSNKEKVLLELLEPICDMYNLPKNTFMIGDLEVYTEVKLRGDILYKEKKSNTRDEYIVYGVCKNKNIILDRKALRLNRFVIQETKGFGKTEYRMLLTVFRTISHELAHLLYNTKDNTVEHYVKQDEIMCDIEEYYNNI